MGAQGSTKQHSQNMTKEKGLCSCSLAYLNLDGAGGLSAHTLVGRWHLVIRLVVCLLPGSESSFPACRLAQPAVS